MNAFYNIIQILQYWFYPRLCSRSHQLLKKLLPIIVPALPAHKAHIIPICHHPRICKLGPKRDKVP